MKTLLYFLFTCSSFTFKRKYVKFRITGRPLSSLPLPRNSRQLLINMKGYIMYPFPCEISFKSNYECWLWYRLVQSGGNVYENVTFYEFRYFFNRVLRCCNLIDLLSRLNLFPVVLSRFSPKNRCIIPCSYNVSLINVRLGDGKKSNWKILWRFYFHVFVVVFSHPSEPRRFPVKNRFFIVRFLS